MDEDQNVNWYEDRPQPRPLCVIWEPNSPPTSKEGGTAAPQFLAHVYCGQTAAWIKMSLGTEVGLGPGHIVLDGDLAAPSPKEAKQPPTFRSKSIVAKRSPISASAELLYILGLLCCTYVVLYLICNRRAIGLNVFMMMTMMIIIIIVYYATKAANIHTQLHVQKHNKK